MNVKRSDSNIEPLFFRILDNPEAATENIINIEPPSPGSAKSEYVKNREINNPSGDKRIQCMLCPHQCIIKEGNFGLCLVRGNNGGKPSIPYYGKLSALALDPIEKKPLYHFYPGSRILSAGFFGCNLKCPFCQNSSISTHANTDYESYTPQDMLAALKKQGGIGLAYTYSEPAVHIEWIAKTSEYLHANHYKNVLVTNGMINPEPADLLLENIDAANIDLKSFNPEFYKNELKGYIETVKAFIIKASSKIHVEVTTLIIPGKNDSEEEIMEISSFIASIDKNIPYHLSCYFPSYKYTIPPTPVDKVMKLADSVSMKLNFVYTGNTGLRETNTLCPSCGEILIKRTAYSTFSVNMKRNKCRKCGFDTGIIV